MDPYSDDDLPVRALSNKPIVDGTRNRTYSPLLQLPGELRNKVFRYAFQEQCIFVRRNRLGEIKFVVEPENYPTTARYSLSNLLERTIICRDLHPEIKHLPLHINTFRVHNVDSVKRCIDRMPTAVRLEVKCMTLGLDITTIFSYDLMHVGMNRLKGLERVIVDIDFHPLAIRSNEEKNTEMRRIMTRDMAIFIRMEIAVVFE